MEATAKFDYEASAVDELSFAKGDQMKILQASGNWYRAEIDGVGGYVPKNFINIHLPSWYQEDLSRGEAQEKLMSQPAGTFLIRGSQNAAAGDFSISVRDADDVQHFKVLRDSRGQYFLWTEKFPSLNQLVEHYKHTSISKQKTIYLRDTHQQQQRGGQDIAPPLPAPLHTRPVFNSPPRPAPRQPRPPSQLQVRALYSFQAEEKDELDFEEGDVIEVLDRSDESWWRGRVGGRTGLFPSSYTQPV